MSMTHFQAFLSIAQNSETLQSMRCTNGKQSHIHIIAKSIRNTRAAMHTRLVYSVNCIELMYCTYVYLYVRGSASLTLVNLKVA